VYTLLINSFYLSWWEVNKLMKKLFYSIALAAAMIFSVTPSVFAAASTTALQSTNTPSCNITIKGTDNSVGGSNSRFVNNGNSTVSATLTVAGDSNCIQTVSEASWRAPYGSNSVLPIANQTLLTSQTVTYGVGTYTLTIAIPDCMYQVDVMYGPEATVSGTPEYPESQKIGWVQAGTGVCEPTPVVKPVTPIKPTSTPVATIVTPTPVATSAPTPTTPAVATPTVLVNTGPGSVIGIFASVTIVAAIAHRIFVRKFAR
jgi:hypothetical protein